MFALSLILLNVSARNFLLRNRDKKKKPPVCRNLEVQFRWILPTNKQSNQNMYLHSQTDLIPPISKQHPKRETIFLLSLYSVL